MLAWLIASPQCNHWDRIQQALDAFRSRNRLSAIIIDPATGPAAAPPRRWAAERGINLRRQGQPDTIFLCHPRLWTPQTTLALQEMFSPAELHAVDSQGNLFALTPGQQPERHQDTWNKQLRRRTRRNAGRAAAPAA